MKKLLLLSLLMASMGIYAQEVPKRLVNISVDGSFDRSGVSATGEYIFNYNRKESLILANELKENKISSNLIAFNGNEDGETTRVISNNGTNADLLVSVSFGSLAKEELKYWDYSGQKLKYSDDQSGYSIFINANKGNVKPSVMCAREISKVLQQVGFEPNWKNNKRYKLIFEDLPIYHTENSILLNKINNPGMIIEPGNLSNRKESQRFDGENVNTAFAKAVSIGIKNCFGD